MDYEPEKLDSSDADSNAFDYDSRHSFRQREGRRGRINLLNFLLRGRLRDISGLALILFAILAIAAVILLLVALIAFVVQRSTDSANFVPTIPATPAGETGPVVIATFTLMPAPTAGTISPGRVLTPTATIPSPPDEIEPGGFVAIQGTNSLGLRFRIGPGLNYATADVYDEGTRFKVLEGPELANEINWWRLEGEDGTIGWAAGEFLEPVDGFEEN